MTHRAAGRRREPSHRSAPARLAIARDAPPRVSEHVEVASRALAITVAALLAVALAIIAFGPHAIGDYFTETDFYGAYAEGAGLIQHGHLLPSRYGVVGPGYEIALALAGFVVRDLFRAAELVAILSTTFIVWVWFHLLRVRVSAPAAALTTLFLATNTFFFRFGYSATTDAFAVLLQAIALDLLLTRRAPRALALAGVVAGAAFLTRYNAAVLLPAGLIAALTGGTLAERRAQAALLFTAGFLAPVVPWVLYSLAHGGGFSFQLHHNIAYEVFARSKGMTWDEYQRVLQPQFKNLGDVIGRDPGAVFARMLFNVFDHLRLDAKQLLGWPVALAAALGLTLVLKDGSARRAWPLGLFFVLTFIALAPVFYSERYSLALLPVYAGLAGLAFASPIGALVVGGRVWLKPALIVLPLALATVASVREQAHQIDQLPVEVLDAARTLRTLARPGDKVIARKSHVAYHAGLTPLPFPFADSLAQLAAYAHAQNARWLYFSWPEAETRPRFWYLLDTTAVVPGLTPRHVTAPHPAVVYEIGPEFGRRPTWFANDTLVAWHMARARLMVDGNNPDLLYRAGGIAWTRGDLKIARDLLIQATNLAPGRLDVLILLGNVMIEQENGAEAEEVFARAARIDPDNVDVRVGYGLAQLMLGKQAAAAAEWRPAIAAVRSPTMLQRMAALFAALGDTAAAHDARWALVRLRGAP